MKPEDRIKAGLRRYKKGRRGLKVARPNKDLSSGHLEKADHNLIVMSDLNELGHTDWVLVVAYYAMYQASLSVASRIGLESKNHAITVSVLEHFFKDEIENSLLKKFKELKQTKENLEKPILNGKYIDYLWEAKSRRERAQYGTTKSFKEIEDAVRKSREFVAEIKLLLGNLTPELAEEANEEVREMLKSL